MMKAGEPMLHPHGRDGEVEPERDEGHDNRRDSEEGDETLAADSPSRWNLQRPAAFAGMARFRIKRPTASGTKLRRHESGA